jgi:hypothetical protein
MRADFLYFTTMDIWESVEAFEKIINVYPNIFGLVLYCNVKQPIENRMVYSVTCTVYKRLMDSQGCFSPVIKNDTKVLLTMRLLRNCMLTSIPLI